MFIYPMWDSESQRIGKQKCTPLGSRLHLLAELIGFVALLAVPCIVLFLAYRGVTGTFHWQLCWMLALPFVATFIGDLLFAYSWRLADRRGFSYDVRTAEASWNENGKRVGYRYESADE